MSEGARPVRSPVGTTLRCRSWQTEGVLRCLMNNLDPAVAERPDDLVVYGGAAVPHGTGDRSTSLFRSSKGFPRTRRCSCSPANP